MTSKVSSNESSRAEDQLAEQELTDREDDDYDNDDDDEDEADESRDSREWELDEADKFEPKSGQVCNQNQQPPRYQHDFSHPISLRMPLAEIPPPIRPRAKYVETSLDDLSFSSSSQSSLGADDAHSTGAKPVVIHEQLGK